MSLVWTCYRCGVKSVPLIPRMLALPDPVPELPDYAPVGWQWRSGRDLDGTLQTVHVCAECRAAYWEAAD